MKGKNFALLTLALLIGASAAHGQGFWAKKPYTDWSRSECNRVLSNSPWASSANVEGEMRAMQRTAAHSTATTESSAPSKRIRYVAFINSALPVRQALVCKAAHEAESAEQKEKLAGESQAFLSEQFPDTIVIMVNFTSTDADQQLGGYWMRQKLPTVKERMALVGDSHRVEPIAYQAGPGQFQVVFPRTVEGQPLFTEKSRLQLEVFSPELPGYPERKFVISFRGRDMVMDGKIVY